ncbi:MAG: hypothetical protein Aurels2KO_37000 [Aureliella sp.]
MQYLLLDLVFVLIVVGAAIALAKRSVVEVTAVWFALLVSSLIALNSFEPIAHFIVTTMFAPTDEWFYCYLWFASLIAVFSLAMTLILKGFVTLLDGISLGGATAKRSGLERTTRWGISILAAYTLGAFLLTSLHAFPASRDFGGFFPPELHSRQGPILAMGPDYQLLTFTEYVSTPRSALTGSPWSLEGPLFVTSMASNRWASFPIRFAIWREAVDVKLNDRELTDDDVEGESEEVYPPIEGEDQSDAVVAFSF